MSSARVSHALTLGLVLTALAPVTAHAQHSREDVVAFGNDAFVPAGVTAQSVAVFGGDARIEGRVEGDVVSFGGDVLLGPTAEVYGSVASIGGGVDAATGARWTPAAEIPDIHVDLDQLGVSAPRAHVDRSGLTELVEEITRQAVAHGLLFLLALMLMGVTPERLGAMQVAIVRDPARTGLFGLAGYVASAVLMVALAITILGIPAAIALALLLPLATYVGLAASASVIGAALPIERLSGRPVRQVAAGVLLLFVASLVPYLGTLMVAVASCLGFGALLRTRFATTPPRELLGLEPRVPEGPYRTAGA